MTHESNCIRYIYAAYDKTTGEFKGYWAKDPAFSPIALTSYVWHAEFTASINYGRDVIAILNDTEKQYTWKLKVVTISTPKDVE
jgi:hypothetical protein